MDDSNDGIASRDLDDTRKLEPVVTAHSTRRAVTASTVAWAAGALVAGLLLGSGVTWAVTSAQGDESAAEVMATPSPSATTGVVEDSSPSPSATAPALDTEEPACIAEIITHETWEGGFKVEVAVTTAIDVEAWQVSVNVGPDAAVGSTWRARALGVDDGVATFENEDYNGSLDAGETIDFGFDGSGELTQDVRAACVTE